MIGIVLGLGFQWWPALTQPWQYIAFIFVYIDIIDYWIDYAASRKKFPSKREVDIILDIAVMFALFLYIYSTQVTINYFLISFLTLSIFDALSIVRTSLQHQLGGAGKDFFGAYLMVDITNAIICGVLVFVATSFSLEPLTTLMIFIGARVVMRIIASIKHKHVFFEG
jgi:hypothetical protein